MADTVGHGASPYVTTSKDTDGGLKKASQDRLHKLSKGRAGKRF